MVGDISVKKMYWNFALQQNHRAPQQFLWGPWVKAYGNIDPLIRISMYLCKMHIIKASFYYSYYYHRYIHQPINPNDPPIVEQPRPQYPYRTIGCVFNHQRFFANSQVMWAVTGSKIFSVDNNKCPDSRRVDYGSAHDACVSKNTCGSPMPFCTTLPRPPR